jgi:hypothetical protein
MMQMFVFFPEEQKVGVKTIKVCKQERLMPISAVCVSAQSRKHVRHYEACQCHAAHLFLT